MARRLTFKDAGEMQNYIYRYFEDCKKNRERVLIIEALEKSDKKEDIPKENDDRCTDDMHPTISGLSLVLGLTRQSLINYEKKEEFFYTIEEAKQRIESYSEQKLFLNNSNGVQFSLTNNFNWRNRQDVRLDGGLALKHEGLSRADQILRGFGGNRTR